MSQDGWLRAYTAELQRRQEPVRDDRPASDPYRTAQRDSLGIGRSGRTVIGNIVDAFAYVHAYRVAFQPTDGLPIMICTSGVRSSTLAYGACDLTTYVPGTRVVVLVFPGDDRGYILCALPTPMYDPAKAMADFIHQTSRCGLKVDTVHTAALKLDNGGGITDWSAGRPIDSLPGGEWGRIFETGVRVFADSFQAQFAVDEATGLFLSYLDQYVRLGGVNLALMSSGMEFEHLHDEGELYAYEGYALHPWEQYGLLKPGGETFRDVSAEDSQDATPHYAAREPTEDKRQAFHRTITFRGYGGQGVRTITQAPPDADAYAYEADDLDPAGLTEIAQTMHGKVRIQAARGLTIAKRAFIPSPRRKLRVEDPRGDTLESASFSGMLNGAPQTVKPEMIPADDAKHLQKVATADDGIEYEGWESMHPYLQHTKDWSVPKAEDANPTKQVQAQIPFGMLTGSAFLNPPDPLKYNIDHRYGEAEFFANEAFLKFFDDGGIVLSDGYGSEVRATGGSMWVSAPADLWLCAGRNVNIMGGHDVILKAKYSIDLSATSNDIRLAAWQNVQILAGASQESGSVLVQSSAPENAGYRDAVGEEVAAGGIHFKSADAPIALLAKDIYLRTGGETSTLGSGNIVLDAKEADVVVQCDHVYRYMTKSAVDYFTSESRVQSSTTFTSQQALIGSDMVVTGKEAIHGSLETGDNIRVIGHIYTTESAAHDDKTARVGGGQITSNISDHNNTLKESNSAGDAAADGTFTGGYYANDAIGNDEVIAAANFTFRNSEQMMTDVDGFKFYELRWQQLARAYNEGKKWTEMQLTLDQIPESGSYPYPGQGVIDEDTYVEQDSQLFDRDTGNPKSPTDDAGLYEDATLKEGNPKPFSGNYRTIA